MLLRILLLLYFDRGEALRFLRWRVRSIHCRFAMRNVSVRYDLSELAPAEGTLHTVVWQFRDLCDQPINSGPVIAWLHLCELYFPRYADCLLQTIGLGPPLCNFRLIYLPRFWLFGQLTLRFK